MADAASYVELTDDTFASGTAKGVVLVDFWAPWCGPCLAIAPAIEALAKKYAGNPNVTVAKLNVDDNPATAEQFQVLSIPTLITFVDGEPSDVTMGLVAPPVLEKKIEEGLKALDPAK